ASTSHRHSSEISPLPPIALKLQIVVISDRQGPGEPAPSCHWQHPIATAIGEPDTGSMTLSVNHFDCVIGGSLKRINSANSVTLRGDDCAARGSRRACSPELIRYA